MAKKIKQIKLAEEDICKNSGKEISHTISKIKEHEKLYTFVLVIIFMITIFLSVLLGLSVDNYNLYDASYYSSNFSMRGQQVVLTSANIMSDDEGIKSETYNLEYVNNTTNPINYILRFALDEQAVERCNCKSKIVPFQKLKFSIDGQNVQQFTEETMIIKTGMISPRKNDLLQVHIWIDDSLKGTDCQFYGKFIIEELEDMDA